MMVKCQRADEEVKCKVQEIERRLREEETVVDTDVDRKSKLYVVRKKFLDEIAGEIATVQEKSQKAIIQREIDNLLKLRDAYMELVDKVQQKMRFLKRLCWWKQEPQKILGSMLRVGLNNNSKCTFIRATTQKRHEPRSYLKVRMRQTQINSRESLKCKKM